MAGIPGFVLFSVEIRVAGRAAFYTGKKGRRENVMLPLFL